MDFFIGPCVIESEQMAIEVAAFLKEELSHLSDRIHLSFKASFDKANRSSLESYRGPGLEKGLAIFEKIKGQLQVATITDYHEPSQADEVASVVDTLQVPAFLCRQTDMIVAGAKACARHKRQLKIKKGQFLAPWDTEHIVKKASCHLDKDSILLTERGTSFGYNNLIVDMSSFHIMKSFGVRAIHDATHCVQLPGGLGSKTGGKRENILTLAKAAVAAGADGIFMEAHPNPDKALSDASTVIALDQVKGIVEKLLMIREACHP